MTTMQNKSNRSIWLLLIHYNPIHLNEVEFGNDGNILTIERKNTNIDTPTTPMINDQCPDCKRVWWWIFFEIFSVRAKIHCLHMMHRACPLRPSLKCKCRSIFVEETMKVLKFDLLVAPCDAKCTTNIISQCIFWTRKITFSQILKYWIVVKSFFIVQVVVFITQRTTGSWSKICVG